MIFLVNLTTTGIINSVLCEYLNWKYERKYNHVVYVGMFIVYTIIITCVNFLNIPILNLIGNLVWFISISIFGYKHESVKEYCDDVSYLFMLIFLDSISYFLVGFIYPATENIHVFRMLSSSLIVLLLNMVIKRYVSHTKIERVPIKELVLYFIVTVFYLFLIYVFSKGYDLLKDTFSKGIIIFIVLGHVMIDLLIYYYLDFVGKSYKMEKEITESNKQIEIKNIYYNSLKNNYDENRKIIHDFKNYLQVLENTYENNFEKAKKIKNEIIEQFDKQKIRYDTSSEILDVILVDKEKEANSKGIEFIFKMEVMNLDFISELDMITIFGNLYDNAIEANEITSGRRYIETAIYQVREMIIIRIENSCMNNIEYVGDKIRTTKKNHNGIGTRNIKKSVKRYNGVFDIRIENERCYVIISIPVNECVRDNIE